MNINNIWIVFTVLILLSLPIVAGVGSGDITPFADKEIFNEE